VTLGALTDYVQRHVPDYVKDEFGADCKQHPQPVGPSPGIVTLVRLDNAGRDAAKKSERPSETVEDKPKKDPPDSGARGRLVEGRRLLEQREFQRAVEVLTEAIQLNAKLAEAYAYRACASAEIPALRDKALADAERCVELAPRLALDYAARAWVNVYKGQNDRALADCEEAIRQDPRLAAAYEANRIAYYHKNDFLRAIEEYSEAIRCEPSAARCNRRGVAHMRRQNWDAAYFDYSDCHERTECESFGLLYR
jgi:tetratricopeptide (TPR) repeat protein